MQVLLLHPFYRRDTEKPHERRDAPLTTPPTRSLFPHPENGRMSRALSASFSGWDQNAEAYVCTLDPPCLT